MKFALGASLGAQVKASPALGLMTMALAAPPTALGLIHEKIAAACRAGGEEVVPPGQVRDGQSFVRALQASGSSS